MIGQTIAHYKVTSKLSEGGMGEVYLATGANLEHQHTSRPASA
jgi:serine/threonine protein kinase